MVLPLPPPVAALAAVRSKEVFLLLLIHCLLLPHCLWGVLCLMFVYLSSTLCPPCAISLTLIVFLVPLNCDCKCSMALPLGVVGQSAVCDCGISWSYSLAL